MPVPFACRMCVAGMLMLLGLGFDRLSADEPDYRHGVAESTNAPPAPMPVVPPMDAEASNRATTAVLEAEREGLILQEQLHVFLLALEKTRAQSDAAAEQQAAVFSNRLQTLEQALCDERRIDLELIYESNRTVTIVSGIFAVVVLALMVMTVWYQVRSMNRLQEIAMLPRELRPLASTAPLEIGPSPAAPGLLPAAESSQRLVGALDRLDQRIRELEQLATPSALPPSAAPVARPFNGFTAPALHPAAATASPARAGNGPELAPRKEEQVNLLLGRGQSLLTSGHVENPRLPLVDQFPHDLGGDDPRNWATKFIGE